ncbi:MAG: GFA family protein [Polyangiaceae bacterium]|nr:GFA family protein [Polyangiaceae bacterium]
MRSRHAQCSCGQLRVTCDGDPIRVSICHCLACQRRTGSPFGQQARWPADKVKIEGVATSFVRIGDSGVTVTFRFCPTCGSNVYYDVADMPGVIAVPVGAFADPNFPPPTFSVYEARKHGWVNVPESIEHMD